MDLIQNNITPAEGEQSVRTYCCTYYKSKLLGFETEGYLGVTNKRVIFQATGSLASNKNVIQSEVPIADISGISSFKGIYFSIPRLLGAAILTIIIGGLLTSLIGGLAILISNYTAFQVIGWLLAIFALVGSLFVPIKSIWRSVLAGVSMAAFLALGGASFIGNFSLFGGRSSAVGWQLVLAGLVAIYGLICAYWYARRPTFSLEINSKGGSSTPITISSASGFNLFNITVGKSLNAEPAKDAEEMLNELGAVILDIQMLGDYGISKWKTEDF
jgi:hypothetical protein